MKHMKKSFLAIALLQCCIMMHAEDFSADNIFYNIISRTDLTVEVTFQGDYFDSQSNEYTGKVTIPTSVTHNDTTYNVTKIGDNAFNDCYKLTSITIPEGVTSIGNAAFRGCSNLTSIKIPESLTLIGNGVFYDCSKITSIHIPNSVTSIGNGVFTSCSKLISVTLPESITSIGQSIFYDCSKLVSVTIPEGVTTISDYAFGGCTSLTSITIPENVTLIKNYAFEGCKGLTSITCKSVNPTKIAANTFHSVNKDIPIYVPAASVSAYQTAKYWDGFTNFQPITYLVTFIIDGTTVTTERLGYGETIVAPTVPEREGYTFSGWSEYPATMPANDITISGTFSINKYLITFKIEDEVIAADSLEYGSIIIVPEAPVREGYTFDGWGEIAKSVPANDQTYYGSYSINSYALTYTVDGDTIQTYTIAYGDSILIPADPEREGYTFCGWGELPELMPANDVTVYGTFSINKYVITFLIDDEIIKTDSLDYGSIIDSPEAPEREGYTFGGWKDLPDNMPANDITIHGIFIVNKYLVTFRIGDEVIAADSLEYGSTIIIPESPEREGHTFDGWGEVDETVPANDVTYEGSYTVNRYHVNYYVGEELVYTVEVAYGDTIPEYTYEPADEGLDFMGWIGDSYETMPAHDVTYIANIVDGIESLTNSASPIEIYDLSGRRVADTDMLKRGIYIVNGKKIMIK